MTGPYHQMELHDRCGDHPVFRWNIDGAHIIFLIDHDQEHLDVHYVMSDEPGKMSSMIDALVRQLPFDCVRFIAPLDDDDKDYADEAGEILEERDIITGRNIPENDRNIRDVLHDYEEVVDEYYDGNEYEMLITIWNTE